MLVDSQMQPSSLFAPASAYGTGDYAQELSDIFHTELFASSSTANFPSGSSHSSGPGSSSSGSRESTPHVLTPPQSLPPSSFPDIAFPSDINGSPTPSFFNFLDADEDVKALDPLAMLSSAPYDFFGASFSHSGRGSGGGDASMMGIDPQLVGSPAAAPYADFDSSPNSDSTSSTSPASTSIASPEESIVPVKVGGHGKARKGTVATGGIKKASASSASTKAAAAATTLNKENAHSHAAFMPSTTFKPRSQKGEDDDDDDDLPADWRPPPEVFQKMSSKEKRQLRNKISARNFRVRRKEYISTLEDNIAERDRLLSAIRAELGSTQSENVALRQEIAALKRTLLDGRGAAPVLPPPAPLASFSPTLSAASTSFLSSPTMSPTSSTSSGSAGGRVSPLPRANPLKDVGASGVFWGGAHGALGGGYTSVHTARIPELLGANPFDRSPFATGTGEMPPPQQQENLNPALNGSKVAEVVRSGLGLGTGTGATQGQGQDAFGDANPFTVRSLDAYRMHLWGRMAAQYRHNKEHSAPSSNANNGGFPNNNMFANPSPFATGAPPAFHAGSKGLAGGLRPLYFAPPTLGFPHSSSSSPSGSSNSNGANGLAASLAGLSLSGKGTALQQQRQRENQRAAERERESQAHREREQAMYAALASQTLLRRLGGAFWEAFSGSSPSTTSSLPGSHVGPGNQKWDVEKVQKVLDGRAVVQVVDVDPQPQVKKEVPASAAQVQVKKEPASPKLASRDTCSSISDAMRGLSLGRK